MVLAGKRRSVPLDHLEVVELLGFVFYVKADLFLTFFSTVSSYINYM